MADFEDDAKPAPKRIGVREFQGTLTSVLKQVRQGRTFLVTSSDEVLAEIHPPSSVIRARRQPGRLRGKIRMASDFDKLPLDLLAAMEGRET